MFAYKILLLLIFRPDLLLFILIYIQVYKEKEFTDIDLKQGKIRNFANVSIVVSSEENHKGINSVGEFIVDEPEDLLLRSQNDGNNVSPSSAPLLQGVESMYEEQETTDRAGTL